MTRNFICEVTAVQFTSCSSSDWPNVSEGKNACPSTMYGIFQYEGYQPFEFSVLFDPMGGCWTLININGRMRSLTRRGEDLYHQIADAAMEIACHNRGGEKPEDFIWTMYHTENTSLR